MLEIIVIAVAALLGLITQRILGFGTSSFLVPALLIYFSAPTAVGINLMIGSLMCAVVLYSGRHKWALSWSVIWCLFIASIPGILIGTYIATHANKSLLQIIIGILIIISIYVQRLWRRPARGDSGNGTPAHIALYAIVYCNARANSPNNVCAFPHVEFYLFSNLADNETREFESAGTANRYIINPNSHYRNLAWV
jgi:uncharacterized membrane protein YfcA